MTQTPADAATAASAASAANAANASMYRQAILDHYKNPRNWGTTDPAHVLHEGENPLCGDKITVSLRLDGERIVDAKFEGQGCAISQAAADIFLESIKGRETGDVLAMERDAVLAAVGIPLSPARVKCASLGHVIVRDGLKAHRGEGRLEGPSRTE